MEELKVVISLKGEGGTIGVQGKDCDPVFTTFEGGIEQAYESASGLIEQAREQWESSPRYPETQYELTPQQPAPQQTGTQSGARSKKKGSVSQEQQPMF